MFTSTLVACAGINLRHVFPMVMSGLRVDEQVLHGFLMQHKGTMEPDVFMNWVFLFMNKNIKGTWPAKYDKHARTAEYVNRMTKEQMEQFYMVPPGRIREMMFDKCKLEKDFIFDQSALCNGLWPFNNQLRFDLKDYLEGMAEGENADYLLEMMCQWTDEVNGKLDSLIGLLYDPNVDEEAFKRKLTVAFDSRMAENNELKNVPPGKKAILYIAFSNPLIALKCLGQRSEETESLRLHLLSLIAQQPVLYGHKDVRREPLIIKWLQEKPTDHSENFFKRMLSADLLDQPARHKPIDKRSFLDDDFLRLQDFFDAMMEGADLVNNPITAYLHGMKPRLTSLQEALINTMLAKIDSVYVNPLVLKASGFFNKQTVVKLKGQEDFKTCHERQPSVWQDYILHSLVFDARQSKTQNAIAQLIFSKRMHELECVKDLAVRAKPGNMLVFLFKQPFISKAWLLEVFGVFDDNVKNPHSLLHIVESEFDSLKAYVSELFSDRLLDPEYTNARKRIVKMHEWLVNLKQSESAYSIKKAALVKYDFGKEFELRLSYFKPREHLQSTRWENFGVEWTLLDEDDMVSTVIEYSKTSLLSEEQSKIIISHLGHQRRHLSFELFRMGMNGHTNAMVNSLLLAPLLSIIEMFRMAVKGGDTSERRFIIGLDNLPLSKMEEIVKTVKTVQSDLQLKMATFWNKYPHKLFDAHGRKIVNPIDTLDPHPIMEDFVDHFMLHPMRPIVEGERVLVQVCLDTGEKRILQMSPSQTIYDLYLAIISLDSEFKVFYLLDESDTIYFPDETSIKLAAWKSVRVKRLTLNDKDIEAEIKKTI